MVLVAMTEACDRAAIADLMRPHAKLVFCARTVDEAATVLASHVIAVVICDADLPGGGWEPLHAIASEIPDPPLLVISSRLADAALWSRVLNLGGYDVIETAGNHCEVARVLDSAAAHAAMR